MSIEQMIVLAVVILLPLLEALVRVRRVRGAPSQSDADSHPVAQPPPASPRSPLSNRHVTRVIRSAQQAAVPAPPSPRRPSDNAASPAVRNLRRAIIAAAILGPPSQ